MSTPAPSWRIHPPRCSAPERCHERRSRGARREARALCPKGSGIARARRARRTPTRPRLASARRSTRKTHTCHPMRHARRDDRTDHRRRLRALGVRPIGALDLPPPGRTDDTARPRRIRRQELGEDERPAEPPRIGPVTGRLHERRELRIRDREARNRERRDADLVRGSLAVLAVPAWSVGTPSRTFRLRAERGLHQARRALPSEPLARVRNRSRVAKSAPHPVHNSHPT